MAFAGPASPAHASETSEPGATAAALTSGVLTATASTPGEQPGDWEFTVAPYIWLTAMTGTAGVGGNTIPIDSSISDLFAKTDLVFALAAQFEAWRKRRWGMIFNGMWSVMQQDNVSAPTPGPLPPFQFDLDVSTGLFELVGAYSFGDLANSNSPGDGNWGLQPFLGARVTVMSQKIDPVTAPNIKGTRTWVDPILGARNVVKFGDDNRWSWTLLGDVGGFGVGSDFSWQAVGTFGYDFTMFNVPSTFVFGGRALSQDYSRDGLKWDVIMYGPVLGLALHF